MTILAIASIRRTVTLAIAGSLLGGASICAAAVGDGQWHFRIVPYLWLPEMSSSVNRIVPGPVTGEPRRLDLGASVGAGDYLDNLDMALMLTAGASKGKWSILTDIIYTDFGGQDTRLRHAVDPDRRIPVALSRQVKMDLSATVWDLVGGYRVVDSPSVSLDLLAGMRYLGLGSDIKLSYLDPAGRYLFSQKVSLDQDNWDGVVGLRGRFPINGTRWFVPFYGDVGTGDSELTWQAMVGVGYRFDWGETMLAWRAIGYDFDGGDIDLTMSGLGLAVAFGW